MPDQITYTAEEISAVWQQRFETLRDARKRLAADGVVQKQDEAHRYVVARSGAKRFAYPLARVAEVLPLSIRQQGTPIPGAPPAFWGLLLVRGEVRPVFDIKLLLGVSAQETDDSEHILFVHDDDRTALVGLKTDRVEQIETLPEQRRTDSESAPALPGRFISRLYQENAEMPPIQIVNVSALLASLRGDAVPQDQFTPVEGEHLSVSTDDSAQASVEKEY